MKPIILVIVIAAYTMYVTLHNTNTNNARHTATTNPHHRIDARHTKKPQTVEDDFRVNYLLW